MVRCRDPQPPAGDVIALVERGDVQGASIGFLLREADVIQEPGGNRVRLLRDVILIDAGPVLAPAYKSTSVKLL